MQSDLSTPLQPQVLAFREFITGLFYALDEAGVRFCVLRNYEGFPAINLGGDLDLLIAPSDLPYAIRALRSIQGIRITGYSERSWVAHAFVEGVSPEPNIHALQVDFLWLLSWKGNAYLPTETILDASILRQAEDLSFRVPLPVHEAAISLFASLLVGGWLKEKYFPEVQRTFANDKSGTIAALSPQFGPKISMRLVESVIDGDRGEILGCIKPLRISLTMRSLLRKPLRSAWAVTQYLAREITVRFSPGSVETVRILASDGRGEAIIEDLLPMLYASAKTIERSNTDQLALFERALREEAQADGFNRLTRSDFFVSIVKVLRWLLKEWWGQFVGKKNLTLRICEDCYHNLLIDPKNYWYRGPKWFARFVGELLPTPDLWILLDPAGDGAASKNHELSTAKIDVQVDAYRSFVKTRKSYIILNASKPLTSVTEDTYLAIIDILAQRAAKQLRRRFDAFADSA